MSRQPSVTSRTACSNQLVRLVQSYVDPALLTSQVRIQFRRAQGPTLLARSSHHCAHQRIADVITGEGSREVSRHSEKGKEPTQVLQGQLPILGPPPRVQGGSGIGLTDRSRHA